MLDKNRAEGGVAAGFNAVKAFFTRARKTSWIVCAQSSCLRNFYRNNHISLKGINLSASSSKNAKRKLHVCSQLSIQMHSTETGNRNSARRQAAPRAAVICPVQFRCTLGCTNLVSIYVLCYFGDIISLLFFVVVVYFLSKLISLRYSA